MGSAMPGRTRSNRNYFWILEGIPYLQSQFWSPYSTIRADDFSRFLLLSRKGRELAPSPLLPESTEKKLSRTINWLNSNAALNFAAKS